MSKENVGGLLGMMSYMDGERPYYLVGKRPLN